MTTDAPLWIYLNCPTIAGNPAQFDPAFSTGSDYFSGGRKSLMKRKA
jgi:hypothetical protein